MKVLFSMLAAAALATVPFAAQAQNHGGYSGGRGSSAHAAPGGGGGYRSGGHGGYSGGQRDGGGAGFATRRGTYRAAPSGYSHFGAVNDRGFGGRRGGATFADRRFDRDHGRDRGFGRGRGFGVGFYGGYYPYDYAYDGSGYYPYDYAYDDGGYYPSDEGYDSGYAAPYGDDDYGAAPDASDYGADGAYTGPSYGGYYDAGPERENWSPGAPPADCGQWVWRAYQRQYQWVPAACGPCPPGAYSDDQ